MREERAFEGVRLVQRSDMPGHAVLMLMPGLYLPFETHGQVFRGISLYPGNEGSEIVTFGSEDATWRFIGEQRKAGGDA